MAWRASAGPSADAGGGGLLVPGTGELAPVGTSGPHRHDLHRFVALSAVTSCSRAGCASAR
jgi:hypothetical protein